MHDATLMLNEAARKVLAQLERVWQRVYANGSKGKGWQAEPLVRSLKRKGICETEHQAWEVLEKLLDAGAISLRQGGRISPHQRWNATILLAEARIEQLKADLPDVDNRLGLSAAQEQAWRRALESQLREWSIEDQLALAEGLRRLANDLPGVYQLSPYVASARYLLGSSKLLEALPTELVRAFDIEPTRFQPAETWLLASVPEQPEGLLLIENAQSFSQACRVGCDKRLALICTFGYGLSLANALESGDWVRLVGQGAAGVTLPDLLALPSSTYWGDLDPEGLRIYQRLKAREPKLRLSALYAPMIQAMEEGLSHPLDHLMGKGGQRPAETWRCGLDQEWLPDGLCLSFAGQVLSAEQEERTLARLHPFTL
ncbi:Wadjet anti-phage system protein JetD domain-containing protein [Billgrantia sp. C5P2]|uniref:Wadjet anti-phage system protein JetD domain-containing protein n=1 Tax=Billgrantia sp. C5P2 TaxID=3436239 RepID=UPI004058A668